MKTIRIAGQEWMAENLNVDIYRNGDPIPLIRVNEQWRERTKDACFEWIGEPEHVSLFGKFYNWYAVNDPRGLAPEGWHIPSDEEWQSLIDNLGGSDIAGGKLKEIGTMHWKIPNVGAADEFGFKALPAGYITYDGYVLELGEVARFWSSTEGEPEYDFKTMKMQSIIAIIRELSYNEKTINKGLGLEKNYGLSIRCVRD